MTNFQICGLTEAKIAKLLTIKVDLSSTEDIKRRARQDKGFLQLQALNSRFLKVCGVCEKRPAKCLHHPDYTKPTLVVPICYFCHANLHFYYDAETRYAKMVKTRAANRVIAKAKEQRCKIAHIKSSVRRRLNIFFPRYMEEFGIVEDFLDA